MPTFSDVTRLARSIHQRYPLLGAVTAEPRAVGIQALRQAVETEASVARSTTYAVYFRQVQINGDDHKSHIRIYPRHSIVDYNRANNRCWARFCLAKELMHLYSSSFFPVPKVAFTAGVQLRMARNCTYWSEGICDGTKDLDFETFAYCLAIETMIPWAVRGWISDQGPECASYAIAGHLLIPQVVVEQYRRFYAPHSARYYSDDPMI